MIGLTIIVPIYGAEKYLRKCVDTILMQTYNDYEVLLVDDGSKDACPEICDDYACADPRVRVLHKLNAGYGAAVNTGLDHAKGKWIGIVEPDDWIESDMFKTLIDCGNESGADVVKSGYYKFTGDDPAGLQELLPIKDGMTFNAG